MRRKCLRLLTKFDKLLCKFFSLKPPKSMRPDSVKMCQRTIRIESCRRMHHVLNLGTIPTTGITTFKS